MDGKGGEIRAVLSRSTELALAQLKAKLGEETSAPAPSSHAEKKGKGKKKASDGDELVPFTLRYVFLVLSSGCAHPSCPH